MIRNRIKTIIFFMLVLSALPPIKIKAGAGKSFGLFAGGAVAGGLIGSAIAKRNRRSDQQTVVQERVVERPIYVQQQPQQIDRVVTNTHETQNLKYQLDRQQQQIMDLKRELRQERKEAERRTRQQRSTKPTTKKEYSEKIFDDYDPQIEG